MTTMDVLLLRFDAPLLSFGAEMVDQHGVVQAFPTLSMLTGLLGNALGYRHCDAEALSSLQDRLRFASRIDRSGEALVDYQTADLGQPYMNWRQQAWTTRGRLAERLGASGDTTHIRFRHFRADSIYTLALTLLPPDKSPTVDHVEEALHHPYRPLFIGRKTCLPSEPILLRRTQASTLRAALEQQPRVATGDMGHLLACWEATDSNSIDSDIQEFAVSDERDWHNQIHTGRRMLWNGPIDPPPAT